MSAHGSVASALRPWIEPWMDVLLIGFSPEVLAEHPEPARVHCARSQRRPVAGTFDCVAVWVEAPPGVEFQIHLEKVRGGGLLALGWRSGLDAEFVQGLLAGLVQSHQCLQDQTLGQDARLLVLRQVASGERDLFGLRRARHRLMAALQRVERLAELAACTPQSALVTEAIAELADQDRFELQVWLGTLGGAAAASSPAPLRGHRGRPLAEEAVRFRHFRSTTLERLATLSPEAWHQQTPAGCSAAQSVRAFADAEDRRLTDLEREIQVPGHRA